VYSTHTQASEAESCVEKKKRFLFKRQSNLWVCWSGIKIQHGAVVESVFFSENLLTNYALFMTIAAILQQPAHHLMAMINPSSEQTQT
jgi:hypothetical protein